MGGVELEMILVGVLLQRPQTEADLQRFLETTGRFMRSDLSMADVVGALRDMEAGGWVVHDAGTTDEATRYAVTDDGERAFMGWLREYRPTLYPSHPDFFTQLRFRASFLGREAVLEMLDAELEFRATQIGRNRHRDRTERIAPMVPFDRQLAGALMNWEHFQGIDRMDRHVAACLALRERLEVGDVPFADLPNPLVVAETDPHRDRTDEEHREPSDPQTA